MEELLEMVVKRLENLEKLVEKYYTMLKVDNELDFVVRGTYLTEDDVKQIIDGDY